MRSGIITPWPYPLGVLIKQELLDPPVHVGFPARCKLHSAQIGALLRVAPGTYVPAVAIRVTEILPLEPPNRGLPTVSKRNFGLLFRTTQNY